MLGVGRVLCVEEPGVTELLYLVDRRIFYVSDKILEYLRRT